MRKQKEQLNSDYKWINHIQLNLDNLGMSDVWNYHGNGFTNLHIKEAVKLRIKDIYKQKWNEVKSEHPYCEMYAIFKTDWKLEHYLIDLNYQQRVSLCKFRCRSNYLPIANSRFSTNLDDDIVGEECICPLCSNHVIGDEFHYLFVCPFFEDDRRKVLTTLPQRPDLFNIISLFNSSDGKLLNKLANFVNLIMKIFEHKYEWEDGT